MTEGACLIDRIRHKCIEDGDCLLWQGAMSSNSTPVVRIPKTRALVPVRRLILEAAGRWKDGALAANTCGNKACVADEHSIAATRKQLQRLTVERTGYHLRPARNAKIAASSRVLYGRLTSEMREQIMASDLPQRKLAAIHGVSQHAISELKQGKSYREYSSPFAGLGAR